jgi:hypothetical protein
MDFAMASTACRACSAVVPDRMGRQQLSVLASPTFVVWRALLRLIAQVGATSTRLAQQRTPRAAPGYLHATWTRQRTYMCTAWSLLVELSAPAIR